MRRYVIGLVLASLTATAAAQEPIDSAVARFYALRWGQPAWVFATGMSRQADVLLDVIAQSDRDALEPADYVTTAIDSLLHRDRSPDDAWRLDSLLTHSFLLYARDLSSGRVDPAAVDTQWTGVPAALDLVSLLNRASDEADAGAVLDAVTPPERGYRALRGALQRYRGLAATGAWPHELGERLAAEGYDTTAGVAVALRQFQRLHGLAADGVVGPDTRSALDVSAAARAAQIALNLERWRWLPRELGEQYIVVNSAAFMLELVEHDSVVWQTRAIVGRVDWPTPIVSSAVTGLSFRPMWRIPRIIAARELLPLIQRDTSYLRREQIRVYGDSALRGVEVDPATIDWTAVTESTFAYQLVQEPGGTNPLGGVKLVFRNPFAVFIHDTPSRHLFSELWRTFSHGCVRIENAAQLAGRLLPGWAPDSIRAAMTEGGPGGDRERWVGLPEPVPVYLVYWTAWPTADGLVAFNGDAYNWDAELARALEQRRAGPVTLKGP
jgi:murein L,D-transpeptidase YcbB/YkuD